MVTNTEYAQATKILERKRNEWLERAEHHRRAGMEAHCSGDTAKRDEERQLAQLASDNIHGLEYAIAVLKSEQM